MARSNGGGCSGFLVVSVVAFLLGMFVFSVAIGALTVGFTERDGGFDISFDLTQPEIPEE